MAPLFGKFSTLLHCLLPFILYYVVHYNDRRGCEQQASVGGAGSSVPMSIPPKAATWAVNTMVEPASTRVGGGGGGVPMSERAPPIPAPVISTLELWSPSDPMPALRGTCWMLRPVAPPPPDKPDDMLYEICLGDRIKQIQHPVLGRAVFGTFAGFGEPPSGGGYSQNYVNGNVCEGFGERKARVDFMCDKAATTPILQSVLEPDVCTYVLAISSVEAC